MNIVINTMKKTLPKIVITGSEGLIGKALAKHLTARFRVLPLDLKLGHDLNDEKFVNKWFALNRGLYGLVICHAFNPVPGRRSKKVTPENVPLSELRDYLETNVLGPFKLISEFVKNNKSGRIITLSSIYGQVSPRHDLYSNYVKPIGYSISKGAVVMMTKYLAAYYAPDHLINSISLGGVADQTIDPKFKRQYEGNIPAGRMMKIKETLPVFDFLLDSKNTYTTGADILCDGGWTAW